MWHCKTHRRRMKRIPAKVLTELIRLRHRAPDIFLGNWNCFLLKTRTALHCTTSADNSQASRPVPSHPIPPDCFGMTGNGSALLCFLNNKCALNEWVVRCELKNMSERKREKNKRPLWPAFLLILDCISGKEEVGTSERQCSKSAFDWPCLSLFFFCPIVSSFSCRITSTTRSVILIVVRRRRLLNDATLLYSFTELMIYAHHQSPLHFSTVPLLLRPVFCFSH